MNKTNIEWVKNLDGTQGFTSNPIKGYCPMGCYYCYSRRDYDRFGWDKTIRWDDAEMYRLMNRKKPAGIFIGSMHEIFLEDYIKKGWTTQIVCFADTNPQHRIYLLTKQPQNLIKFSPFPGNCWVGITCTNIDELFQAEYWLYNIKTTIKFVSLEPLLQWWIPGKELILRNIDWVIIGAQTRPYKPPKVEWVRQIVDACVKANIPVFLKNNLKPLIAEPGVVEEGEFELRQEMPKGIL